MVIEYLGRNFFGFQTQRGRYKTVQEELERSLSILLREPTATEGAARTDTGVHAVSQVATFSANDSIDPHTFLWSLNSLLRPDIVVRALHEVPDHFDPRRSASAREYAYLIFNRASPSPFLQELAYWHPAHLDEAAMNRAATELIGVHDFTSFCSHEASSLGSTVRHVEDLTVTRAGDLIVIRIKANAFLHNMVRIIAGTLLEVGGGRRAPEEMASILAERSRAAAGKTLAAHGLFLSSIEYPLAATGGILLDSTSSDLGKLLSLLLD